MKNKYVLGFDLGAGSGRAMLGGFNGKTLKLKEVYRFTNQAVSLSNDVYWDILSIFSHVKKGLSLAMRDFPIESLAIDTWGVDFGLIDKKGRLLNNPYHYRHPHTAKMPEYAQRVFDNYQLFKLTGIATNPYNTLLQLLAMKRDRNIALKHCDKLLFIPDLLNYFLTGQKSSEKTIASTSQLTTPFANEWCLSLIEKAGLNENIFCDIINPSLRLGELAKNIKSELNLGGNPMVYTTASHDTAAAISAIPCKDEDFLYISSGTWSLFGILIKNPILTREAYLSGYTNETAFDNKIRFLKNIMGLWIIQECKRDYETKNNPLSYNDIAELSQKAPAFKSFIDVNDKAFFTPNNMMQKIQNYCKKTNQEVPNSIGEVARCVYESLAFAYREAAEHLQMLTDKKYDTLYIVGGGSNNAFLNQVTANALNKRVIVGIAEASAVGNIICQLRGQNLISGIDESQELVKNSFKLQEFTPKDVEYYNENYQKFKQIKKGNL